MKKTTEKQSDRQASVEALRGCCDGIKSASLTAYAHLLAESSQYQDIPGDDAVINAGVFAEYRLARVNRELGLFG